MMIGQAPAQGTATAATTSNKHSTALLNDPTFADIHDVFLLGWSLVELKSRIQIMACNLSLDSITFDKSTSTFSASVLNASSSTGNTSQQQPNVIDAALNNIVLKDVAQPQSITIGSKSTTTTAQSLSTELRDNAWLTSVLRAVFKQIVALHIKRFPASSTTNTVYDLPSPPLSAENLSAYPYPYLYPLDVEPNYATVGISCIKDGSGADSTIASFVTNYKLYDVTRRALNCLTLLLDEAEESLVPTVIAGYQRSLVQALRAVNLMPPADPGTKIDEPAPDDIKAAVKVLSNLVIRLIEAWDSFLLESSYAATSTATNDPDAQAKDYEMKLAAYLAGRSLAALSWNVSVATVPLESTLTPEQQKNTDIIKALTKMVQTTWLNAFNDRDVNSIQYQITALGTAMDAAYYRLNPDIKAPGADTTLAPPNLELPSQALSAVRRSLDYWQATVTRMCSSDSPIKPLLNPISATAPTPGKTSATAPPSANDISSPSRYLDWELSKALRTELIQQAAVWQSLILYQQGLQSFTLETITQRMLNDFMHDVEQAASREFFSLRMMRGVLVGITILLLIIVLLGIYYAAQYQHLPLNTLFNSPLLIIAAIGAAIAPFVTGITSRLGRIGTFFGGAGTAIEGALQQGYDRILIEFDYLNHNVAITYPLIEFFIWEEIEFGEDPIKDGYDFLVNVFWTAPEREEELQRVVRAAFGPIGAFVGAQLEQPPKSTQKKTDVRQGQLSSTSEPTQSFEVFYSYAPEDEKSRKN